MKLFPTIKIKYIIRKGLAVLLSTALFSDSFLTRLNAAPALVSKLPPLVLLQDIHRNAEAQQSLFETLSEIQKAKGRKIKVGIEGASGDFQFEPYFHLPDASLTRKIGKELLEENKLAGPLLHGLTNRAFELKGIENAPLYVANVEAYRSAMKGQPDVLVSLERESKKLETLKKAKYSQALLKLDQVQIEYQEGKRSLSDYLSLLTSYSQHSYLAIETFLAAHEMEQKIQFQKVESERTRFVEEMARHFSKAELKSIENVFRGFEKNTAASTRFETLIQLAKNKGLTLSKYPALENYVRYIRLSDNIQLERLFDEIEKCEQDVFSQFSRKDLTVEGLIRDTQFLSLTKKLVQFDLTPNEWKKYRNLKKEMSPKLQSFEDFYRLAEDRNNAIAETVVRQNLDAIVVGGFHTEGLLELLSMQGRKIRVVRPTITRLENQRGSGYLSVFAVQKTPLEKLFSKWKLFLSPPASIGTAPLVKISEVPTGVVFEKRYSLRVSPNLKQAASRVFRHIKNHGQFVWSRAWIRETVLFTGPLALGFSLQNLMLVGVGVLFNVVGLTLAHFGQDHDLQGEHKRQRFVDRVTWSAVFTIAFFVGALPLTLNGQQPWASSIFGLGTVSFVHWINHFSLQNPFSALSNFVFHRLHFPKILMSMDLPENDDLQREARTDMLKAIQKQQENPGGEDEIQKVFDSYTIVNKDSHLNEEELVEVVLGFAEAFTRSRLTTDQEKIITRTFTILDWTVRANKDFEAAFKKGVVLFDQAQKMSGDERALALKRWELNHLLVRKTYEALFSLQPTVFKRVLEAGENSLRAQIAKSVGEVFVKWKAAEAGRSPETPNPEEENVRRVMEHIREEAGLIDDEANKTHEYLDYYVMGLVDAIQGANFSKDELRMRSRHDHFEAYETYFDLKKGGDIIRQAYYQAEENYNKHQDPGLAKAIVEGQISATFLKLKSETVARLKGWRASNPEKVGQRSSSALTPLFNYILHPEIVEVFTGSKLITLQENMRNGFSEGLAEFKPTALELVQLMQDDIAEALKPWYASGYGDLRHFDFVQSVYFQYVSEYHSKDNEFPNALKTGLRFGWSSFVHGLMTIELKKMRGEPVEGVEPEQQKLSFPEALMFILDTKHATLEDIKEALVRAHLELDPALTKTEYAKLTDQYMSYAFESYSKSPTGPIVLKLFGGVYTSLQQREREGGHIDVADTIADHIQNQVTVDVYHSALTAWDPANPRTPATEELFTSALFRFAAGQFAWPAEHANRLVDLAQRISSDLELLKKMGTRLIHDLNLAYRIWHSLSFDAKGRDWLIETFTDLYDALFGLHKSVVEQVALRSPDPAIPSSHAEELEAISTQAESSFEEWRANSENSEETKGLDPFYELLKSLVEKSRTLSALDIDGVVLALVRGMIEAKPTGEELVLRFKKDIPFILEKIFTSKGDVRARIIEFLQMYQGALTKSLNNAQQIEVLSHMTEKTVDLVVPMLKTQMEIWKNAPPDSPEQEGADSEIRDLNELINGFSFGSSAIIPAYVQLIQDLKFTPEQLEIRVTTDMADELTPGFHDFGVRALIFKSVYEKLLRQTKVKEERVAIENAVETYPREASLREVFGVLADWRKSSSSIANRDWKKWEFVLSWLFRHLSEDKSKSKFFLSILSGVLLGIMAMKLESTELKELAKHDVHFVLRQWVESGLKEDKPIWAVIQIYESYSEAYTKDKNSSADEALRQGMEDGWKAGLKDYALRMIQTLRQKGPVLSEEEKQAMAKEFRRLINFCEVHGFQNSFLANHFASGLLETNVTVEEISNLARLHYQMALARGERDVTSLPLFRVVESLYGNIVKANPAFEEAIQLVRDDLTNVGPMYKLALRATRGGGTVSSKSFGAALNAFSLTTRAGSPEEVDRIKNQLTQIILEESPSAEILKDRTDHDIREILEGWALRALADSDGSWEVGSDRDLQLMFDLYTNLAWTYKTEKNDEERALAIFNGLTHVLVENFQPSLALMKSDHGKVVIQLLVRLGSWANKFGEYNSTQLIARKIKNLAFVGHQLMDVFPKAMELEWVASWERGESAEAVENALEWWVSEKWARMQKDTHSVEEWADFVRNVYFLAHAMYCAKYLPESIAYVDFTLRILNLYPSIEQTLPPQFYLRERLQGLRAAARLVQNPPQEELEQLVPVIETAVVKSQEMDPSYLDEGQSFWGDVWAAVFLEASRTGDERYYDQLKEEMSKPLFVDSTDPFQAQRTRNYFHLTSLMNLGHANPSKSPDYLEKARQIVAADDPDKMEMRTIQDLIYLLAVGSFRLWAGEHNAAEDIFQKALKEVMEGVYSKLPTRVKRQYHGSILVHLACAVGSQKRGDAAAQAVGHLINAYQNNFGRTRWNNQVPMYVVRGNVPTDFFLQGIDKAVMAKMGKESLSIKIRVELIRFLYALNPSLLETESSPDLSYREKWKDALLQMAKENKSYVEEFFARLESSPVHIGFLPWPAKLEMEEEAHRVMAQREEEIKRAIEIFDQSKIVQKSKGASSNENWQDSFRQWEEKTFLPLQITLHFDATFFCLLGMVETGLHFLRKSVSTLKIAEAKLGINFKNFREIGVMIDYVSDHGSPAQAAREVMRYKPEGDHAFKILNPLQELEESVWEEEKNPQDFLTHVFTFVSHLKNDLLVSSVNFVLAQVASLLGRVSDFEKFMLKATVPANDNIKSSVFDRARAKLQMAYHVLKNISSDLSTRVEHSSEYIDMVEKEGTVDEVAMAVPLKTSNQLLLLVGNKSPTEIDLDKVKTLSEQTIFFLDKYENSEHMPILLSAGLPEQLVELAFYAGFQTAPSREIIERLERYKKLWLGGAGEAHIKLALALYDDLANKSGSFLVWDEKSSTVSLAPREKNIWRVVSLVEQAEQVRNQKDEFNRLMLLAREEVVRLITQRISQMPLVVHLDTLQELLMEFPLARRSFIQAALFSLDGSFDSEFWTETRPVEMNKPEKKGSTPQTPKLKVTYNNFTAVLHTLAMLGDPQVLIAFDEFLSQKDFPQVLRDNVLIEKAGIVPQMEEALSLEDWILRVERLKDPTEPQLERLRERAIQCLSKKGKQDLGVLRQAVAALRVQKGIASEKIRRENLIREARKELDQLHFSRTRQLLSEISRDAWDDEMKAINAETQRLEEAWNLYQTGEDQEAEEKIGGANGEAGVSKPARQILRDRLAVIPMAEKLLSQNRPREAQSKLLSLTNVEKISGDPRVQRVQIEVESRIKAIEQVLQNINGQLHRLNDLPEDQGQNLLQEIYEQTKNAYQMNAQFYELTDALVKSASGFISKKKFFFAQKLLHIVFKESGDFDPTDENFPQRQISRDQIEMKRALARAFEMRERIIKQRNILRDVTEAEIFLAEHSSDQVDLETRILKIEENGANVNEKDLFAVQAGAVYETKKGNGSDEKEKRTKVNLNDLGLTAGMMFMFSFSLSDKTVVARIPMMFLMAKNNEGKIRFKSGDEYLFLLDPERQEFLQQLQSHNGKLKMEFLFVRDMVAWDQLGALEQTLSYLDNVIRNLEQNKKMVSEHNHVLDRLLGLNISPQPELTEDNIRIDDDRIRETPAQASAVYSGSHPQTLVTVVQGPAGSGKTRTESEVAHQLVQGAMTRRGDVVVITGQSHAGVDTIAEKLQNRNIAIVRSASYDNKVATELKENHKHRLKLLMQAIENHHTRKIGFVYLATNNGLRRDRKCFSLLTMYLNGVPMMDIRDRYAALMRDTTRSHRRGLGIHHVDEEAREPIRPIWFQEEFGQANFPETLLVERTLKAQRVVFFGDHDQLPPHGMADQQRRVILEAKKIGFKPSVRIFSHRNELEGEDEMQVSLGEMTFRYAEAWLGGANVRFLDVTRRGHWAIGRIVQLFYPDGKGGYRLKHRDEHQPDPTKWEPLQPDTVMLVKTHQGKEWEKKASDESEGASRLNFIEAEQVIRAATFFLNHPQKNQKIVRLLSSKPTLFRPRDIMMLSPYKSQVELINEMLRIVAILNDISAGATDITDDEYKILNDLILKHVRFANSKSVRERSHVSLNENTISSILRDIQSGGSSRRDLTLGKLYVALNPLYDLDIQFPRKISRSDIPNPNAFMPGQAGNGKNPISFDDENGGESLDEQRANILMAKTVHSVQGQEKPIVIVSFVLSGSDSGFLKGKAGDRILNVALSRAQQHLIVVYSAGSRLERLREIEKRTTESYKLVNKPVPILQSVPDNVGKASLREAWNISLGNTEADDFNDRWAAPIWESAVFLSILGQGLTTGDPTLIVGGIVLKAFIFPALHHFPNTFKRTHALVPRSWGPDFLLAGSLTTGYMLGWFVLLISFGMPGGEARWVALIVPIIIHWVYNNRDRMVSPRSVIEKIVPPTHNLGVDSINGDTSINQATSVEATLPSAGPSLTMEKFSGAIHRRARSGA